MSGLEFTFKQWLLQEAKKKVKEPDWPDADYSSGYSQLRDMQKSLTKDNLGLQLFVPKRRDPKKMEELKRNRRWWDAVKDVENEEKAKLKEEVAPILTGFTESPPGDNKPNGSFWTSTAIKRGVGYTSRWYEYVQNTFPSWQTDYGYLFEVKSNAMVFESDYLDQFYEWAESYGKLTKQNSEYFKNSRGSDRMRGNYPWDTMARYFDGVHHSGYSMGDEFTYGWDVESTAWFNTNVLTYKGAVRLHHIHEEELEDDE